MSKLLIVESPGKIKKITEYLGNDYIVAASVGHIIDLDERSMSINLETFEPEYRVYPNKVDVVNKLVKFTNKVGKENVFLAADEDREGEMIAWSCAKELKLKNPKRIVFNSITAKELKHAVSNPKEIDQNLVKAQQARRILDRLAGYLISPILKRNGFYEAKSAGRVQSVVVKIVVDKEREIEEFYKQKKSTYFYIGCDIKAGEYELSTKLANKNSKIETSDKDPEELDEDEDLLDEDLPDELDGKSKKKNNVKTKFNSKSNSNAISTKSYVTFDKSEEDFVVKLIKAMIKSTYSLLNKTEKIRKANAPPPFTTSTLQQLASQRLNLNAKETMSVAQKLYEAGHITYMRTDSTAISDEASTLIKDVIEAEYGLEHHEKHTFINKKANTQEAHECVRPTKPQFDQIDSSYNEKRLYNMIWKRTIQSQMKTAEYQNILIEIKLDDKKKILENYKLVGTLENLIYEGYLLVDGKKKSKPLDIKILKPIDWIEINGIEDTQKPPSRYNDASLINRMDPKNLNIGRPSTYASFIEKIQERKYVKLCDTDGKKIQLNRYNTQKSDPKQINMETKDLVLGKEKKKLIPTELGISVTEFLEKNFKLLMDYKFTANMEKELDDVAEGELNHFKIIKKFYEYIMKCLSEIVHIPNLHLISNSIILGNFNQEDIKLLNGKHGRYIQCGTFNYNFTKLLEELGVKEKDYESKQKLLCDNIIDKINNPAKQWKINKNTYTLAKGQFGYYVKETSIDNKKSNNYSLNFLIDKLGKENQIDLGDSKSVDQVINLITIQNIIDTIEYFKNYKKNKSTNQSKYDNNNSDNESKKVNKSTKSDKSSKNIKKK